ncbi:MAG TPA: hypothetical protein VMB20_08305 [Candidatus Acidoferrum sp.]|nr:hypothetical protein [Candidatus Acidoferrum sp.]
MRRTAIRVWFTLAAAVVAAAVADPLVEAASNAGWFGAGNFTDHSTLDIVPALISGVVLIGVCLVLRIRRELLRVSVDALRYDLWRVLPALLTTQLAVLFVMETSEQVIVAGHPLGGTIWLGGPLWFSLFVHVLTGIAVAWGLAFAVCACARTTVRMIRRIRALAMRALHDPAPLALRRCDRIRLTHDVLVRCRIGNRAPPFAFV